MRVRERERERETETILYRLSESPDMGPSCVVYGRSCRHQEPRVGGQAHAWGVKRAGGWMGIRDLADRLNLSF